MLYKNLPIGSVVFIFVVEVVVTEVSVVDVDVQEIVDGVVSIMTFIMKRL